MRFVEEEIYLAPEAEIIEILAVDVILTSGPEGDGQQTVAPPSGSWVPID